MIKQRQFPIQGSDEQGPHTIPESVYMAAYEVYCHVWSPQEAMIDLDGRGCRGGFGLGELVGFLYARKFPKDQWKQRVDEAWLGMKL